MSWDDLIEDLLSYFQENTGEFNYSIEELDSDSGYLDGCRIEPMEYLDDFFIDSTPRQIMEKALEGTDSKERDFNPDREYFYWDYNQLVSTDEYDYSSYLERYFVERLYGCWQRNRARGGYNMDLPEYVVSKFEEYYASEE